MNVVMCGSSARIYGEDVRTCKQLPVGTYDVCFSMNSGYSLSMRPDLVPNEDKIYGSHHKKIEKVIKTFDAVNRNLGIILSGRKGCGKSLFVRSLSQEVLKRGIPVLIVSGCFPGIADFISSIQQVVLVVFDEFEKIFSHTDDEHDPQDELLPMFDGMDNGKKLFVITCNDTGLLNDCLLNRPGRFHYHFDVENPAEDEIREYMSDNLLPEYHGEIESVVKLSAMTDVTYDFLRAIAFELNQGYHLSETMQDLNISNDDSPYFNVEVVFEDGRIFKSFERELDFNDTNDQRPTRIVLSDMRSLNRVDLSIRFRETDVNIKNGKLTLEPEKLLGCNISFFDKETAQSTEELSKVESGWYCAKNVKSIIFTRSTYGDVSRFVL